MISILTRVVICDNSGVRFGTCIKNLGGFKKKSGRIGELIVISVNRNSILDFEKITKKVYLGLIVNTVKKLRRSCGFYLQFDVNKIILLTENKELLGTRFDCLLPQEFRYTTYSKLTMFCKALL